MANIEFYYADQWKLDDINVETREHPNFPSENTQHRDKHREWRTQYGAGSGWGRFFIGASNNKLDFEDSGANSLTATIGGGTYDTDTLIAEIESELETASDAGGASDDFTVEYLETGANANKFKITDEGGNFKLLWSSGANKANSIAGTIGYSDSADDQGTDNYTADEIRIHTAEYIRRDLGANTNIYGCFIAGHNFQAGANLRIRGSDAAFGAWDVNVAMTIIGDYAYYRWTSAQNYRYWEVWYADIDNPDTYCAIGTIHLCTQPFTPDRNFIEGHSFSNIDPSYLKISEDGQITSNQLTHFKSKRYDFRAKDESADFKTMFDTIGTSKSLFIIEDPGDVSASLYYARLTGMDFSSILYASDYWGINMGAEEIR